MSITSQLLKCMLLMNLILILLLYADIYHVYLRTVNPQGAGVYSAEVTAHESGKGPLVVPSGPKVDRKT